MLLFRSEDHVSTWYRDRGESRGASLDLEQAWGLAEGWYSDRLDPDWKRRTAEEAEELFASLGLTGDFWRLSA